MPPEPILPSVKIYPRSTETKWARMGSWLLALLTFNFALLISACGLDIEDPTPPSPPVWAQKSLPEEWPERGIDAHESGGLFLEWETNAIENISAYYIYRAYQYELPDSIGEHILIKRIEPEMGPTQYYLDQDTRTLSSYSYVMKSQDEGGNFSNYSDTLFYKILQKVSIDTMLPNGLSASLNNNRTLSWRAYFDVEMQDYTLTILTYDNIFISRNVITPGNYTGDTESWDIPESISLDIGAIYKWRIDMSSKYVDDRETVGSESFWATFIYNGD
jgi:hypothetical protein